ncbi:MAG TPA: carbon storage regulator [Gemmataceae bacterium]|nr:carbon storage regulator [Gemmataceae bacterium]
MLILSRKKDEQLIVRLGDQTVVIRVLSVMRERVRIGITAPREVAVHREEVARRIDEELKELHAVGADAAPTA